MKSTYSTVIKMHFGAFSAHRKNTKSKIVRRTAKKVARRLDASIAQES